MHVDPLDEVFAALRVQSAVHARLEAGAPWGVAFACGHTARFGLVMAGECWMQVGDNKDPAYPARLLKPGDCYVLLRGMHYILSDKVGSPTRSCTEVVRDKVGGVAELGGDGAHATIITGWFTFDELSARPLMDLIPAVLYAHFDAQRAQLLESSLQLLQMETAAPGLGSNLVISRLADIVFVQAIRAHAAESAAQDSGWLSAITEKKIGAALRAMHKEPARDWTVEALAAIATLSRSAFAVRFKERVGETPLAYLTRWRMFRAACLLRQSDKPQAEIAAVIGYETEAAFSKAFKRATGIAPGAYRRGEAVRIDASLSTVPPGLLGNNPTADQHAYS